MVEHYKLINNRFTLTLTVVFLKKIMRKMEVRQTLQDNLLTKIHIIVNFYKTVHNTMVGQFFLILVQITQIRQIVFLKITQQLVEVHCKLQIILPTLILQIPFFMKILLLLLVAQQYYLMALVIQILQTVRFG